MFKPNPFPPSPSGTQSASESPGQMRLDPVATKMGEIGSKSEPLPVTRSAAMFFDFGSDDERDAFFQGMRKRSARLRSFVVFPSRLDTQTSSTLWLLVTSEWIISERWSISNRFPSGRSFSQNSLDFTKTDRGNLTVLLAKWQCKENTYCGCAFLSQFSNIHC